jgi:hypothetical protein
VKTERSIADAGISSLGWYSLGTVVRRKFVIFPPKGIAMGSPCGGGRSVTGSVESTSLLLGDKSGAIATH